VEVSVFHLVFRCGSGAGVWKIGGTRIYQEGGKGDHRNFRLKRKIADKIKCARSVGE
jgi:hypothetical protein